MPQDVLALFDLDHTLLPHDTDEQWVEFLLARGVLERATFEAANRDLAARYARGEAGALEFTEFYLSTLAGRSVEDLDALRRDFIAERVNGQIHGHDIAFDYDNTSTRLQLYWGDGEFPVYGAYTNSFSCGG